MKNYKISDLFLVNKDENVSKLNDEIKKFLESNDFKNKLKFDNIDFSSAIVMNQGSYSRHTASYLLNGEGKSDIDILFHIENHYSSTETIKKEDYVLSYKSKISENIFDKMPNPYEYKGGNISNEYYVKLKNKIFNQLKINFPNFLIKNKNKCIEINCGNINFDICLSLNFYINNNKNLAAYQIITNDENENLLSFPKLNKEYIKSKNSKYNHFYEYIRVFKNINKLLIDNKFSSFLLECLLYRIDNNNFNDSPTKIKILYLLDSLKDFFDETINNNQEFKEINDILLLDEILLKKNFGSWYHDMKNFINERVIE